MSWTAYYFWKQPKTKRKGVKHFIIKIIVNFVYLYLSVGYTYSDEMTVNRWVLMYLYKQSYVFSKSIYLFCNTNGQIIHTQIFAKSSKLSCYIHIPTRGVLTFPEH